MILLDTNLLTRLARKSHPHGAIARVAISKLVGRGEQIVIVPQNLYEFWAVATRPIGVSPVGQNGLGMTINQASQWLRLFQRRFSLLPDREDVASRWHDLVKKHAIRGFRAHDARFVAAMECYGISQLLTFNGKDFEPFAVSVINPSTL
jgi:predicted nucleic acid-binding protein